LVALDCSISWTRKNMSYSFLQLMLEGMHTSNELKITSKGLVAHVLVRLQPCVELSKASLCIFY
jgi:hypothetical protein